MEMVLDQEPDVVALDLEMSRLDGLAFLEDLMRKRPIPVVALSTFGPQNGPAILKALELGAVEVVEKPRWERFGQTLYHLVNVLKEAVAAKPRSHARVPILMEQKKPMGGASGVVTAIGASFGGVVALREILSDLPAGHPGLVVIQRMPSFLIEDLVRMLNETCRLHVRVAEDGDLVRDGQVLIAPGDRHLVVERIAGEFRVFCLNGDLVNRSKPSVDVLFHSVARAAGPAALGVLLTGIGPDGAGGLLALREGGAFTLAQDEATCVVFGAPLEALSRGAVDAVIPLEDMAAAIQNKTGEIARRMSGGSHG
jgi:two-component system chemotaxis response regulator CheB